MGAFQLPDSVLGDAIGCLIYSFLCLIANSLLVWLIWTHNERKTYIAFIAYFTLIATFSSIIQQLYDYIFWRDLMVRQYYYGKDNADDAEVQYQKGIFGLKLVLSYIRACFSMALLSSTSTMSCFLACDIPRERRAHLLHLPSSASITGKETCIHVPN